MLCLHKTPFLKTGTYEKSIKFLHQKMQQKFLPLISVALIGRGPVCLGLKLYIARPRIELPRPRIEAPRDGTGCPSVIKISLKS